MSPLVRTRFSTLLLLPLIAGWGCTRETTKTAKSPAGEASTSSQERIVTKKPVIPDSVSPLGEAPGASTDAQPKSPGGSSEQVEVGPEDDPTAKGRPEQAADVGKETEKDAPPDTAVQSEAALQRFEQLLRRKPLHRLALVELVKHYVQRDDLPFALGFVETAPRQAGGLLLMGLDHPRRAASRRINAGWP